MFSKFSNSVLSLLLITVFSVSCQTGHDNGSSSASTPAQTQAPTPAAQPARKNALRTLVKPIVVMISIDGFRYDYLEKYQPPTLLAWAKEGVRAKGIIPSFPTLTFPNHISLITGLRPGHHGIVGNAFYDEARKQGYTMADKTAVNDGSWYRGEPIWTAAEKNGMLAATCFWVGSESKIGGVDPTYLKPYDEKVSNAQRVDWVMEWLSLPEERKPHFISLYFSDVDTMGHRYGPDADETKKAVLDIDKELGRLKTFIDNSGQAVQVVAVSDHGMKMITETVDLSAATTLMKMKDSGRGALTYFYSDDPAQIETAFQEVKVLEAKTPGKFKIYKAKDLPPQWQLDDVDRRGDLIVVGEPGAYIGYKRDFENGNVGSSNKATHGWDVANTPELQGLFIASGPMFKQGLVIPAFDNVNVYPMVMSILDLPTSVKIDGNLSVLQPILK